MSSTFTSGFVAPNGLVDEFPKPKGEEAEVGVADVPNRAPPFDVPNVKPVDITGLEAKAGAAAIGACRSLVGLSSIFISLSLLRGGDPALIGVLSAPNVKPDLGSGAADAADGVPKVNGDGGAPPKVSPLLAAGGVAGGAPNENGEAGFSSGLGASAGLGGAWPNVKAGAEPSNMGLGASMTVVAAG